MLYLGAEFLVQGGSRLAARLGVSPLIVGLTVVAFGTSSPELLVSLSAALRGANDVAVGNVVGSNVFNVTIILGLAALVRPPGVPAGLIRREIPLLLVVSAVGFALVALGHVSRLAGISLLAGLCVYCATAVRAARKPPAPGERLSPEAVGRTPAWLCLALVLAGLAVLVAGARLFVAGAVETARAYGVSDAAIGLTVVAAGTSLPELATSLVAAVKKETDVAVGNIVGSNVFNVLGILRITATISPLEVTGIGLREAGFLLGSALLMVPFAFSGRSISRAEGAVFLFVYGLYPYSLWPA